MKSEEAVRKFLADLEELQSKGRKNPKRNIEMKTLKWVLEVPESDEQPVKEEPKEEVAVAQ